MNQIHAIALLTFVLVPVGCTDEREPPADAVTVEQKQKEVDDAERAHFSATRDRSENGAN